MNLYASFAFEALCRLHSQFRSSLGCTYIGLLCWTFTRPASGISFYSKIYGPGAVAINAMYQPWAGDAVVPSKVPLLWVFPSFELIGSGLGKLQVEQVDVILIVPKFRR